MGMFIQRIAAHAAKIIVVAILAIPAMLPLVRQSDAPSENRVLANLPAWPSSWDAALKFPAQLDLWINDHFGFRDLLVIWNNRIRYSLFGEFPTIQVIKGKDERIFLAAHATTHHRYSNITIACGYQFTAVDSVAAQINRFASGLSRLGLDARLLIAPSAPIIYTDALPDWLARRCHDAGAPIPKVLSSKVLAAQARSQVYFPMEEVREIERSAHFIPKTWFHWAGTGPKRIAAASVRHFWKLPQEQGSPMKSSVVSIPSDISHLFPGILLASDIETADFAASGIQACTGDKCFPELTPIMAKLIDVSRYRNPRAPMERLVLFSDSFGSHIAGWYASYFKEVVHVSTNNFGQLTPAEMDTLKKTFLIQREGDHLLFLYHDASVLASRLNTDLDKLGL